MTKEAWIKILRGAAIAVGGALLTYGANFVVPFLETSGGLWGPAIAGLLSILIQVGRKFIESQGTAQ